MKRISLLLLSLVFCMIVIGCASSSSYSPSKAPIFDKLIIPGERIGPISLGMPQANVLKTLGTPTESIIHDDGHSSYFYTDLKVFITKDSHVYSVRTVSPEYATTDGIRVGMTEPEVRAKRGKPNRTNTLGYLLYYWYDSELEICFDRNRGNRITDISIHDQICKITIPMMTRVPVSLNLKLARHKDLLAEKPFGRDIVSGANNSYTEIVKRILPDEKSHAEIYIKWKKR